MTIGIGIFLIAAGAILKFATNFQVQNVDMDTVGLILMIAGAAVVILSLLQQLIWARNRRAVAPPADPYADPNYQQPPPPDPRDPRI